MAIFENLCVRKMNAQLVLYGEKALLAFFYFDNQLGIPSYMLKYILSTIIFGMMKHIRYVLLIEIK